MDLRAIGLGVSFAIIWSSAFTAGRIIVHAMPPFHALSLRFALAGVLGLAIGFAMGQNLRLSREQWRAIVIFGIAQNALYLGFNFVAMQWVEASLAAIVGSTMPLLVAGFGWLFRGERLPPLGTAGLIGGLIGVAIIMGGRVSGGVDLAGLGLLALGAVALTVATLAVRGASGSNMMMVVSLQMLVGALALAPMAALEEWRFDPSLSFYLALIHTVLLSSLLATWIWFRLVLRIGAVKAAAFHFLNPVFGVGIAALLLGERVGWIDVLGVAIVAAGILAVQLSRQTRAPRPAQTGELP